jgi:hypothetical protein
LPGDTAAAIDCSSELETGYGWVPAAAVVVGSPIALAAAEASCSECQTQSGNVVAELRSCHRGLPLLLYLTSCDTVLLGDGHVDQLIIAVGPDGVETVTELSAEPPPKPVSLLLVRVCMISSILA